MTSESSLGKIASTLSIKNIRLPPEAYASLEHVHLAQDKQDQLPLVDLDYVHFHPSSSSTGSHIVEVRLRPSSCSSSGPTFERFRPFASISREIASRPSASAPDEASTVEQVVSRFSVPNLTYTQPHTEACFDARGSIGIPGGLCHPHIHLDKAYLLDRCALSTGTFDEALSSTAAAKAEFTSDDVRQRMRRLVSSSVSHGVTCMRAFAEVDPTVGLMCLEAAIAVKHEYAMSCNVQIVAFAQDPIFYPDNKDKQENMHRLLREAASRNEVDVIGSAPYVEGLGKSDQDQTGDKDRKLKQKEQQKKNIDLIFDLAQQYGKHVDFHLDYDLDPPGDEQDGEQAMIPYVVSLSQKRVFSHTNGRKRSVTLGHCTKLSSFTETDLDELSSCFSSCSSDTGLPPISFVSLPPSDLYMQGRSQPYSTRPRATIPLLELAARPDLAPHTNWAIGVNNVSNLFTPQGDADPLAMLPMMVGVWQSAKPKDCELLVGAVGRLARIAAGLESEYETKGAEDDANLWRDLTIVDGTTGVRDLVCAPSYSRIVVKDGRLVSRRRVESEMFPLLVESGIRP